MSSEKKIHIQGLNMENKPYLKPVIIDTDPGDDDSASILWVLASGKFDVKALTVTNGNVGVDKCVINALRVLEVAGRTDIPVYKGAYRPLVRHVENAEWIHGNDGLGDVPGLPLPVTCAAEGFAPSKMAEIVRNSAEPVTILALGPLTNVALAILTDEAFAGNVREVIFMGGAYRVSGNSSPRSSFNVYVDPEAAKVVYNSTIPVVQLGLDVCDLVTQTVEDLDEIASTDTEVSRWLLKVLDYRRNKAVMLIKDARGNVVGQLKASEQVRTRGDGIGLNDLTTTGYLINPEWFQTEHVAMDVECSGALTTGETIIDHMKLWGREPDGFFAYAVDGPALVKQWVSDMKNFNKF